MTAEGRTAAGARPPATVIAATGFAFLLVQLDVSIINVALPEMGASFRTSITGLQWIVDAYALSFAALLLLAGALGDRSGARKVFVGGFVLFVAASLACGLAPTLGVLVTARVMQGAGAALMVPTSLALLNHACGNDGAARRRAIGLWTACGSVGLSLGPLAGGVLVGAFGWRSIFLCNLPIGAFGLFLTLRFVAETDRGSGGFDPAGQILGILMLTGLVGAAIEVGARGWTAPVVLGGFGLALAAGMAFVTVEARGREPMLPLAFFRNPAFSAAILVGLFVNLTLYGMIFVLSIYLQHVRGYTPVEAGRAFLPLTVTLGVANLVAGRIAGRTGARPAMMAGLAVAAFGYGLLARLDADTAYPAILAGLVLIAAGIGLAVPTMTSTLLATVPRERGGVASGVLNTVRQSAGAVGVGIYGSLMAFDEVLGLQRALTLSVVLTVAALCAAGFARTASVRSA